VFNKPPEIKSTKSFCPIDASSLTTWYFHQPPYLEISILINSNILIMTRGRTNSYSIRSRGRTITYHYHYQPTFSSTANEAADMQQALRSEEEIENTKSDLAGIPPSEQRQVKHATRIANQVDRVTCM